MKVRVAAGLALLGSLAAPPSMAQSDKPEPGHRCAAVDDAGERLACYDAAFGRPEPAAARTTTAVATSTDVARGKDDFGLSDTAIRARDPEKAKEVMPESITGTVVQLGYRPTGESVVTLDNGQVWIQLESGTKLRLKTGDTVTIKKASLGSFLLVTPGRVATRVRRVQ